MNMNKLWHNHYNNDYDNNDYHNDYDYENYLLITSN